MSEAVTVPRSQEEVLASVLSSTPLLLLVCDGDGRIQAATGAHVEGALGAPGPFVGRAVHELAAAATVVKDLVARARCGEAGVGRLALPNAVLQLQVLPIGGGGSEGEVASIVAVGLKEVQHASSDEAFMRLFQASPIPIALSSLEGGIFSHCNDAFVRTFGYPREEVVGRGSVELGMWSPDQRARAIAELREKGVLIGHESGVRTKAGDVRDIIFNMERIEFAGRTHLVGFFYDITERKRAEEELRRLYEQLRELDTLKGQLIANVSHELRTPLTLILGLVERLMQSADTPPAHQGDLAVVRRNARSLLKQVNDLLEVARLDAGQVQPRYARIDLADTLRVIASPSRSSRASAASRWSSTYPPGSRPRSTPTKSSASPSTCCRTRSSTRRPAGAYASRSPPMRTASRSASPTRGRASRPSTAAACSSASSRSRAAPRDATAAPGSAWRSCASSPR